MKLLILGATGPTARHVVEPAPHSGDQVTAMVRNPSAGDLAERLTAVTGDATSRRDIAAALAGQDTLIATLGRGNSVAADDLFTRPSAAVIAAAEEAGVSRLLWLSSFGVGHTLAWSSPAQKLIYRTLLQSIYASKEIADEHIRSSGPDWDLAAIAGSRHGRWRECSPRIVGQRLSVGTTIMKRWMISLCCGVSSRRMTTRFSRS